MGGFYEEGFLHDMPWRDFFLHSTNYYMKISSILSRRERLDEFLITIEELMLLTTLLHKKNSFSTLGNSHYPTTTRFLVQPWQ